MTYLYMTNKCARVPIMPSVPRGTADMQMQKTRSPGTGRDAGARDKRQRHVVSGMVMAEPNPLNLALISMEWAFH